MRKWIDKFSKWLCSFGIEFYLHMVCVIVIAMFIARICFATGADRALAGCLAAFVAFICGFFKEIYDNKTTKVFSKEDLIADAIGAVLFLLIWV